MVLFFSGTGNSKYVASVIADCLQDSLVCVNDYIKQNKQGIFHSDTPWVFVFPTYLSTIPAILVDFLERAEFSGNKNAYFIGTCVGSIGSSANAANKICTEKSFLYKGIAKVLMPQNYIALFTMTEADEIEKRVADAYLLSESIADKISKNEMLDEKITSKVEYALVRLVEKMYNGPFTKTKKFKVSEACIGCGICERVCPLNRIEIIEGKPRWHGSCVHCMGCINRCPRKAIDYGKNTAGKTRYVCKEYKRKGL